MADKDADRRMGCLAARQKAMVTAAQLGACGLGRRAIKDRVETGRLQLEFRGVYSVGCGELPPLAREQGTLLVTRSGREKRLIKLVRDAGLPLPETNVEFGGFELDFYWRRERLVVEVDGYNFHRGPGAFGNDREKDLAVRAAGLGMLRFTGDHVLKQPWMVLAAIAGELAVRRPSG